MRTRVAEAVRVTRKIVATTALLGGMVLLMGWWVASPPEDRWP